MKSRSVLDVVRDVVAVVLESIKDTEARDHAARCLQDRFGAPATQPALIYKHITKEEEEL